MTIDLIQSTWASVLGIATVGPDDDFFELGGTSLVVAAAMARLNATLDLDLPLRALFEAPTPAEMAELIAEQGAATTPTLPDWVIPLQREGSGRPVFVFPAGHDEMRSLAIDAQIAAHVGRERPFWGFRREEPSLDRAREGGVSMLAAEYARQMRIMQPDGPYLLFGNCAGGYLAWETARHLLASGAQVGDILFFEVPLRADFDQILPGFTPAHAASEWHLSRDYRPDPLPVALTHLMTDDWGERGWWSPWQRVVRGRHERIVIPVTEMGSREYVANRQAIIADRIRGWLGRIDPAAEHA